MKAASERIGQWTLGSAFGLCVLCGVVRPQGVTGALAGSLVAILSVFLMTLLVRSLVKASENTRAIVALLLMGKSLVVLGGAAAFLFFGHVDVVGFALGVSALVTGVMGGSAHAFLTETSSAKADSPDAKGAV